MTTKRIMRDFKIDEISTVDKPAQKGAKMTIMKRDSTAQEAIAKFYGGSVSDGADTRAKGFKELLEQAQDRKRLWEAREELYPLMDALNGAINSILSDENVSTTNKLPRIEESINDFLAAVRDKLPDVEEELTKFFQDVTAGTSGDINPDDKGDQNLMPDNANKADELSAELDKVTKALAEATEKLEKAEAIAKMSDAEKAYAEKLGDKERDEWMKMSAADRKAAMDKVAKNDETVVVEGQTISKAAVGSETFALYKRMADAEERIAKAEAREEMARLEKRADDELSHLPGTTVAKARILKALDDLDEADRDTAKAMFKAADEALAQNFEAIGKSAGEVENTVEAKISKYADEIAKRDNISKAAALAKAWEENPKLYEEYEAETRAA